MYDRLSHFFRRARFFNQVLLKTQHAGALQRPWLVLNGGEEQTAAMNGIQAEARSQEVVEVARCHALTWFNCNIGKAGSERILPLAAIFDAVPGPPHTHASPAVGQMIERTRTQNSGETSCLESEEPDTALAIGRAHVRADICLWKPGYPGQAWKEWRPKTVDKEWRESHPRSAIEGI